MRQVFLDTETTGLAADKGDRVIEIGCIEMSERRYSGRRLHHYLNPERASHADAVRVHGITDDFLLDKPLFAAIAHELIEFVKDADVVMHNAAFDVAFLDSELERLGLPPFAHHVGRITDSLQMARELFPGKSNSLDALCKRLEVDNAQRELHGALLDAGLLAEVYVRMTRGQDSLVVDTGDDSAVTLANPTLDLSAFELPVLEASAAEAEAHEAMLIELDKASRGQTVWRLAAMA
ncbi:MAG: DNA polymerase III subunit epsilon [Chitinophagaceae bacterium]|nr:DNA polymerase III subunit epsilon [Rubrivivax sp.]